MGLGVYTDQLLLGRHGSPATLTLILYGALRNTVAEVGSDDGPSSLHVEEVGGQGTLGGVGVMLALLALLLLLNGGQGKAGDLGQGLEAEDVTNVTNADISAILEEGGLSNQQVGLTEVVGTEGPNKVLDGRKALIDLQWVLVTEIHGIVSQK